jgi:hypothetical protein
LPHTNFIICPGKLEKWPDLTKRKNSLKLFYRVTKNSMVLATNRDKQINGIEQKIRDKLTQLQSSDFQQRCKKQTLEKREPLQKTVLKQGTVGTHL